MMNRKAFIRTFGCQMNKNDSDIILSLLAAEGIAIVDDPDACDIFVVNTCSVREHAERRALGYIAALKTWRQSGDRLLAVVGCMAQRRHQELVTRFPHADLILGPDSYRGIGSDIRTIFANRTRIIRTGFFTETYPGIYRASPAVADFVSITRGCGNYCSYCVVPYVRGPLRSRSPEDIRREVESLVRSGTRDITLLGQNVNEYRHGETGFAELLSAVAHTAGLFRLRFLTSHPKDFEDSIIDTVAAHPNICPWFHLPLQSGSDRILGLMNRRYTVRDYRRRIQAIRSRLPDATVTTDIIVGFPTETEVEYRETIAFVEDLQFDDAYTYRYSSRAGTAAEQYEPLPEDCIARRLRELIAVQNRITGEHMSRMVGRDYELLFEKKARNGTLGRTRGNVAVLVEAELVPGSIANARIREIRGRTPVGIVTPRGGGEEGQWR
jgi:tRNA-2-methylthio-N6-dimethylallyladenosine synthase